MNLDRLQVNRKWEMSNYTGLTDAARIRRQEGPSQTYELARDYSVEIPVEIGPESFTWFVVESD